MRGKKQVREDGDNRIEAIWTGGKLMVYWSVFLCLMEIVAFFGATKPASRLVDGIAFVFTSVLFLLGTKGAGLVIRVLQRGARVGESGRI